MIYRKKQYVGNVEEKLSADIIYGEGKKTQTEINSSILDQIPVGTVTTTSGTASVSDSANLPLKDIQVLGGLTQTKVGDNLFDKANRLPIAAGTGGTFLSSNNGGVYIPCKPNTTYSARRVTTTSPRFSMVFTEELPAIGMAYTNAYPTPINTDQTNNDVVIKSTSGANSHYMFITFNDAIPDTMVVEGDYDTSTMPAYQDFKYELNVVTGDNTVTTIGKNIFDGIVYIANKMLDASGEPQTSANYDIYKIKLLPNTQYTLQDEQPYNLGGGWAYVSVRGFGYTANDEKIGQLVDQERYEKKKYVSTFTTPNNIDYMLISFRKTDSNIQIEIGNETPYEPYSKTTFPLSLGSIELAKVGEFTDVIFKENGTWYLQKNTRKLELDGTETWGEGPNFYNTSIRSLIMPLPTINILGLGDYMNIYGKDYQKENNFVIEQSTGRLAIVNPSYYFYSDLTAWTNFLSTKKPTLYYSSKVHTKEAITDSTLIEQLEDILHSTPSCHSYYFEITPTSPNATGDLQITYRKDLQTLTDQIATLEARVELLEQ